MNEESNVASILVNLLHKRVFIKPEKTFIIHGILMYNPNTNTFTNININTDKDIFIYDEIPVHERLKRIINSIIIDNNILNGLQIVNVLNIMVEECKIILNVSTTMLISVNFEVYYTFE
jgi:hypothetical protein